MMNLKNMASKQVLLIGEPAKLTQITLHLVSTAPAYSRTHLHIGTRAEGSNVERRVSSSSPNLKTFRNWQARPMHTLCTRLHRALAAQGSR